MKTNELIVFALLILAAAGSYALRLSIPAEDPADEIAATPAGPAKPVALQPPGPRAADADESEN